MKVIVDELPETKGDCIFSKFYIIDAENSWFRCILREAYIDEECDGCEANGYIHCGQIQSFGDVYKSQMKIQDCRVKVNKDGIPVI